MDEVGKLFSFIQDRGAAKYALSENCSQAETGLGAVVFYFSQTGLSAVSLFVFATVSTSCQIAGCCTFSKNCLGQSTFLFMQTASTFCQYATCCTGCNAVEVTMGAVLLKSISK